MILVSSLEEKIFTFVELIPISIGVLTWFGSIRLIRCSAEGITKTYGFVWSETVLWENVKSALIGQIVETGRYGTKRPPYYYVSLRTKSYKNFKILLHWFRQKDVDVLIEILRDKPFPFSRNIPQTVIL